MMKLLFDGEENFELTDEGSIGKNLGVDTRKHEDSTRELR